VSYTTHIRCVKCKNNKFVNRELYQKRIRDYGGEDKLLATYVCRDCKGVRNNRVITSLTPSEPIKPITPKKQIDALIYTPSEPHHISTKEFIANDKGGSCFFPNRYLDGDKTCNSCDVNDVCNSKTKKIVIKKVKK
jgi:hypothetical protein